MTEIEWHFLNALQELHECVNTGDPYKNLMAARSLRLLLLDRRALLTEANREHRLKLVFEAGDNKMLDGPPGVLFSSMAHGVYPLNPFDPEFPKMPFKTLKLDQFLAYVVAISGGFRYTVTDIVLLCANKLGAMHLDAQLDEKQAFLKNLSVDTSGLLGFANSALKVDLAPLPPLGMVTDLLVGIGLTVEHAAKPLKELIVGRGAVPRPPPPDAGGVTS